MGLPHSPQNFVSAAGAPPAAAAAPPAGAADLAVERFRVAQVIRVNAEAAKTNGAEFLVADGNGILRAPMLVGLNSRGEKIDVGLEGRFERFVPVLQISQNGQRLRIQRV